MDKFQNELEGVKRIAVRARARWHEYGEKGSKYFFKSRKMQ